MRPGAGVVYAATRRAARLPPRSARVLRTSEPLQARPAAHVPERPPGAPRAGVVGLLGEHARGVGRALDEDPLDLGQPVGTLVAPARDERIGFFPRVAGREMRGTG